VLTANGPAGGNPHDVDLKKTLILSRCTATADLAALDLFDLELHQVGHLQEAYSRGLQLFDPQDINLKTVHLN
jgi:hypothetical protein